MMNTILGSSSLEIDSEMEIPHSPRIYDCFHFLRKTIFSPLYIYFRFLTLSQHLCWSTVSNWVTHSFILEGFKLMVIKPPCRLSLEHMSIYSQMVDKCQEKLPVDYWSDKHISLCLHCIASDPISSWWLVLINFLGWWLLSLTAAFMVTSPKDHKAAIE